MCPTNPIHNALLVYRFVFTLTRCYKALKKRVDSQKMEKSVLVFASNLSLSVAVQRPRENEVKNDLNILL
jgi:hypothetical protein